MKRLRQRAYVVCRNSDGSSVLHAKTDAKGENIRGSRQRDKGINSMLYTRSRQRLNYPY